MTGECCQLKMCNPDLHIIPINIIFSNIPYLLRDRTIRHYEIITYNNSYSIYERLKDTHISINDQIKPIATDMINYIIDVDPISTIGEEYTTIPTIQGFNPETPFRPFSTIIPQLVEESV